VAGTPGAAGYEAEPVSAWVVVAFVALFAFLAWFWWFDWSAQREARKKLAELKR